MKNFPHNVKTFAEDSKQKVADRSESFDKFWEKELGSLPKAPSSPSY